MAEFSNVKSPEKENPYEKYIDIFGKNIYTLIKKEIHGSKG